MGDYYYDGIVHSSQLSLLANSGISQINLSNWWQSLRIRQKGVSEINLDVNSSACFQGLVPTLKYFSSSYMGLGKIFR